MTNSQIKVVAHRGLSSKYPENTLIAYEAALQLNIDYLEIDIHKTADNKLVVIHDDSVDRTSNGTGKIKDYTMEQLQQLDYGLWKGESFRGQTILEFKDVLKLVKQYNKKLLIEIKKPEQYPGIEQLLLKQLKEAQVQHSNIVIQSFDMESIKKIYATGVNYKLGVLISAKKYWYRRPNFKKIATFAHFLNPNYKLVTTKFVATAHKYNLKVMPYTVNDKVISAKLIKSNIDGIITDAPDIFCDC
ncbi:glycerophosphodiester phosphodiesterase [Staphylococcus sp. 18_1_E_LY]|uniref:Glycerophosphodiester phosphodiesterase n=1 Tax=Staphylococcus lloydii TaxID=2781774 RepID=A0A7T1B1T2_9STAP|nr:glycerophosphodiester phosphodiesterase family protein [Staphylococcus lloydii]MBF7018433.1 glycerophosphodiester phosphodiesterase [Staphylococcus lloydii]MBF7026161.1 glycerophosphodiester phosphodiesterase [Staphylococcus lloydii]QPM76182.1 glycerophosphodiester phosphodiesterase [Staphylococcus lloydii]